MSTRSGETGSFRPGGGGYTRPPQTDEFHRGPQPRDDVRRAAPEPREELPRRTPITNFRSPPWQRRRPSKTTAGVLAAIALAVVALVVAVVSLVTQPEPAPSPTAATPNPQAITDADKAMCQAIGPLMKENDDRSNAFLATGEAGSPERDAALSKFVSDTRAWVQRTQQTLDDHASPPRFTVRALQRYVDDMQMFVASVRPGPGTQYDEAAWTDSIVAYGGVLSSCQQLGVSW
ncbi:hypothetical protein [Mycobacterium bourgelatii]|uniref:Uncharacterized protein n=1 Tax=Mycobacterium bourgelatii TaxID=1273442 RepID=A0A7I9YPM1_MYCBU|nr:hypothetical protein [Mycobacterium bourgelatii]MCV6973762.1 hypothetical protein [Mycobacterium bourgelatii]GFG90625.1 hypothetical protein MBOU_26670 [Mycobacterium bourgelatii]